MKKLSPLYIVGLTGGIASGKTARCNRLNELSQLAVQNRGTEDRTTFPLPLLRATYVNADLVGHESYTPGTACYHNVVKSFGEGILDTSPESATLPLRPIDRKKLGPVVFSDPEKMKLLNSLVWPAIQQILEARLETERVTAESAHREYLSSLGDSASVSAASNGRTSLVLLEAALLVEIGLLDLCDEVWLITVDPAEAVKRVMKRDQVDESLAQKKLSSQLCREERIKKCQAIVDARQSNPGALPLHLEVLDTTGANLQQELQVTIPEKFHQLRQRLTALPQ